MRHILILTIVLWNIWGLKMIDYEKLLLHKGAYKVTYIATEKLKFTAEFLPLCEQNRCGRYGKNYTCPPHIGKIDELIKKVQSFKSAIIWQTVTNLEDSYDFEGMMQAQNVHNGATVEIAKMAREDFGKGNFLVLAAGGCTLCDTCSLLTNTPCAHPDDAISSLEAHGMDVSQIEKVSDMKYLNGINTVTYFSGLFFNDGEEI